MARIVVVGAGGFIGRALTARIARDGVPVIALARRASALVSAATTVVTGDLGANTDWAPLLEGAAGVVHLASSAKSQSDAVSGENWITAEVATARALAAGAARARLRQVVLMSSAKVHGEATPSSPFRADLPLAPVGPYATAKALIEAAMFEQLRESATALAVIRPPLVYGPGVTANFRALLHLVRRAPALPIASIANRRSFIYLENLVDLVVQILLQRDPVRGALLARDDEDLSTPELVRRIGRQFGRTPALLPCPVPLLRMVARAIGRGEAIEQLSQSLQLDDRATRETLSWTPPFGTDAALAATCRWYLDRPVPR